MRSVLVVSLLIFLGVLHTFGSTEPGRAPGETIVIRVDGLC